MVQSFLKRENYLGHFSILSFKSYLGKPSNIKKKVKIIISHCISKNDLALAGLYFHTFTDTVTY